ncbi:MAG: CPBP family intramembrane metalloprotease [Anaerolineae bacterium]|nr:CPBP family intramembrane metalloprotease [Anaerolineae bacterium]
MATFGVVPLLTLGVYRLFPHFETWQTAALGFPFAVFVYVVMVAVPLLIILLRRENFAAYGLIFKPTKYHLDIAATCFVPVALANLPFGMGVDHTRWGGALILAVVQLALLFVVARVLRVKPSAASAGFLGVALLPQLAADSVAGKALVTFLTYALFVGFGEEILYRGYVHSRLNAAFGTPFTFHDVAYGWGTLITALIFGLTHVGILRWMLGLSGAMTWAWGFWTFFGGLVFAYVREKSGSILAPALLHGLPQAIAVVVLLFF